MEYTENIQGQEFKGVVRHVKTMPDGSTQRTYTINWYMFNLKGPSKVFNDLNHCNNYKNFILRKNNKI